MATPPPSPPTTTVVTIPVNEDFDDNDDHHDEDEDDDEANVSPTNAHAGQSSKEENYPKWWDLKKDKYHGYGHWPGKYHGWDDDHHRQHDDYQNQEDYQRFRYHGGRHRRQVVYRINSAPLAPPAPVS